MTLSQRDLKYVWHPCSQMKDYETLAPIPIDHAKGVYLYDTEGKEYIDIVSSWWCNLLGHCHEGVSRSIKNQLDKLEHVIFANFTHEGAVRLCEELVEVLPKGLTKFNFSDNGSASVECALKMAFQYHHQTGNKQKTKFICLSGGYHGETLGALSVGAMDLYAKMYKPMLMDTIQIEAPDCYRCPYGKHREDCACPCAEKAEEIFDQFADNSAALIIEPLLQGAGGMRIYPPAYLKKLRELCDEHNVLLIADEIATGFGRTGKMFACDHADISPDIICLSKGLTGGYLPMSITVTTEKIYNAFYDDYNNHRAFMHSHTYSGNPLGCAAALAVIKVLKEERVIEKSHETARYLNQRMKEIFNHHIHVGEIRSIGLVHAIELVEDRKTKKNFDGKRRVGYAIYKEALKLGLVLRPLGDVLYFNPPLTITKSEIDKALAIVNEAVKAVL